MRFNKIVIVFFILISPSLFSQSANSLLNSVFKKINKVKDYSVDISVKADIPFIKMLPIKAKIYYKKKDKFKVDSKSIAIVPKQGFVQISKLISDTSSYTAILQSSEEVNNSKVSLINIIPLSDTGDVILGKIWLDEKKLVITKSVITSKSNGTISTEYFYGDQIEFGLPDLMKFEIDMKKFKIPKAIAADINTNKKKSKEKKSNKGKIEIKLTNYKVNNGIADSVFKKK
jgi:outer membrane lipoprotein-sorting protein